MKLLILGSEGMVGHIVRQYFLEEGHDISYFHGIGELRRLENLLMNEKYDAVINCFAVVNQEAEEDKVRAIWVNSLLPHFLEKVTTGTNTVVVHRSTDCIFSGKKGKYNLTDTPDATSFYARSKALGELNNEKDITIRTSLIGPETDKEGRGLFNWFYKQKEVSGYANSIWTGITTIEYAREIEWLLNNKKHGVFQLVPDKVISKYDLLLLFEKYYPGNRKITRVENKKVDKSLLPYCDGIDVPDYETMISHMRMWTDNHKELYNYQ